MPASRGKPKTEEPEQTQKDKDFVEKIKTVNVATESRNKPNAPPTVTVCGNALPVDPNSGKVIGPSDPKVIRRRRLQAARNKRVGASGFMDTELPQTD